MTPSFDAAIDFAADLVRIPSPPGGEEAIARRVAREMAELGFPHVRIDEVGNVIGVIPGRGRTAPVMLSCHLDMVDAGDPLGWEHPPFDGVVADGALHGRGAMDIKGPLAIQTHAAAAFVHDPPPGDLIVAHTVYEERGGWGMAHLLTSGGLRPGVVVIGEATDNDLCVGHRGRAELLLHLRGGGGGNQATPERARNALDGLGALLDGVRAFAAERLTADDPILGRATLVATEVATSPASRNVIPDTVTVALDWRVLPGPTPAEALAELTAFLGERVPLPDGLSFDAAFAVERQRSWTGEEVDWEMAGGGYLTPPDHPLVAAAARALGEAMGVPPEVRPWRFATDGRHTAADHGIPTLGFAPGREEHAHTNRERLDLASARTAFDAYPPLIRALFHALQNDGAHKGARRG
jgi:succinyl-diaminopimelate desuccinylase